jgi:type IV secretory pathway VirB10-like protein
LRPIPNGWPTPYYEAATKNNNEWLPALWKNQQNKRKNNERQSTERSSSENDENMMKRKNNERQSTERSSSENDEQSQASKSFAQQKSAMICYCCEQEARSSQSPM